MLLFLFSIASAFLAFSQSPQSSSHDDPNRAGFVGVSVSHGAPKNSERCIVCHQAEVEGYERTSMAHSLRRAGQEPSGTVTANGSTITMRSGSDGYWQTWENGADKTPYRVDYVVGSGSHASGYLVEIGGHLFQSPVAYYKSRQAYDLAPGFENTKNPDFTRPISEECLLCHSGRALPISGTVNWYRSPPFDSEPISCERCHGPVERHLRDPRAGTIVNPAKLEPAARDGVCEQCHLLGAARVANPGKKLSDFIPGQRLENTFTIFHDVAENGASGDFKVISHAEQLARSACARNSGGKLWCGTCHDPHNKPAEPVAYYRGRCLTCHAQNFPVQAQHPAKNADCLSCHMPKRDAKDGGHSAFTDHRIQRRPIDADGATLTATAAAATNIAAWREGPAEFRERNLGIAYIDAGIQRRSSPFVVQGYRMLTEVQRQFSNDPEFFKSIGQALLLANQTSEAKVALERARELDPQSATTEASLAGPYLQDGNWRAATEHLERALALDPLNLPAASTLLDLYAKQGKQSEAASLSEKITAAFRQTSHDGTEENIRNGGESVAGPGKKAEENYKNIDVLRGLPAAQVIPAMQFIAASLGVDCQFCHVEGHFDKDEKKTKRTARAMMRMVASINGGSFDGQRQVTCYSCHRGRRVPSAMEISAEVSEAGASRDPTKATAEKLPTDLPTVSEIIERYVSALGGASAIEAVSSRHESGVWEEGAEHGSVETFADGHGKYALVRHSKSGNASAILNSTLNGSSNGKSNGASGQIANFGHAAHRMTAAEGDFAAMDADLQRSLHLRNVFRDLKEEYPEKIGDNEALVVVGELANDRSVKFYFDRSSGLLLREVRFANSTLGQIPTQIDYADYREADGVHVPMQVTSSDAHGRMTVHFDTVKQNVEINPKIFTPIGPPPQR
jgi:tetratricopeptide (TPR) repeat protein